MITCIDYPIEKGFSSQFGEDKWITDNLPLPAKGFYVDIGANSPTVISNTKFLRDRGWQGIQIDAEARYKAEWQKLGYSLDVGIIATQDKVSFNFHPNPDLSGIGAGKEMPAIRLNDWLKSHKVTAIDLLSCDIEGYEYEVLTSLDYEKHKPSIIIFEYKTNGAEDYRLCPFLQGKGYKEVHRTFANFIYVRGD